MPRVAFTPNLQRHVDCAPGQTSGATVGEALEAVFVENPTVRRYVLDDQGTVRTHMVIFVNGRQIHDRTRLSDRVNDDDEIYVMQALSGG